jgi:hypothetical protein
MRDRAKRLSFPRDMPHDAKLDSLNKIYRRRNLLKTKKPVLILSSNDLA